MTSPASDRIAEFGLDSLCEAVANGVTMRAVASSIGVSFGTLSLWIGAQPNRSARVRDARQHAARLWDEKAEQCIIEATDQLGMMKARELAQHYRWRASKIAPREYGDKLDLNHSSEMSLKGMSDDAIQFRIAALIRTAGVAVLIGKSGEAEGLSLDTDLLPGDGAA